MKKNKTLIILGAGGHARPFVELLSIIYPLDKKIILDEKFNKNKKEKILGNLIYGNFKKIKLFKNKLIFLAIGDNLKREFFFKKYKKYLINLISHTSKISKTLKIGIANLINNNVFIGTNVKIGNNNIINNECIIEHETVIHNHTHISPGCIIGGRAKIGNRVFLGLGTKVLDKVVIADDCIVGAGSTVTQNLDFPGVYVGSPAKKTSLENNFIKNKFVLATYGEMGVDLIKKLFELNINLKNLKVITHAKFENNKNFIDFLNKTKINFFYDNDINLIKEIKKFKPDILLSFHYRKKIQNNIINIPKYGSINVHPSLLPKYAGCFSSVWALFNNEKKTGITFHYMKKKFDSGNIILQDTINIKKEDTAFSLFHKLVFLSLKNLFSALNLVIYDKDKGKEQDMSKRTYYPRKLPNNGLIDNNWNKNRRNQFLKAMHFPPIFDHHKINKKS